MPKLHVQQKGLYVARILVDIKEDRVVNLRVFSVSNEVFHLAGETVISLPKPVIDVTSLELNEEDQESARVINEHVSQGAVDMTLLEALQEFLERNTYSLMAVKLRDCWSCCSITSICSQFQMGT